MPYKQDNITVPFRKITVMGKGKVAVNPDLVILQLGVQTNGEEVTKAQSENAQLTQNVINALQQLGITEIKTIQYKINKLYDYVNGTQVDRGYQVSNILEIRTDQLALAGTIIDTAVNSGANVINSIRFDVVNPDLYYQEALNLAVDNAVQKAQSVISEFNIILNPVPVLITENSAFPVPYQTAFLMREGATPIEPGEMQIEASVSADFIY